VSKDSCGKERSYEKETRIWESNVLHIYMKILESVRFKEIKTFTQARMY